METLNCIEFEERVQEALDARRPIKSLGVGDEAIPCAHCRALWSGFVQIERALPEWAAGSTEFDGADAVIARVMLEGAGDRSLVIGQEAASAVRSRARARRAGRGTAVVVAAAAVLLAVALSLFYRGENGSRVANAPENDAPRTEDPRAPGPEEAPPEEIATLVREAGSAYFVLAREAGTTVSSVRRLVPDVPPENVAGPEGALSVGDDASAWLDSIRSDLRPVGRDVGKAMNFLLEAVSLDDSAI